MCLCASALVGVERLEVPVVVSLDGSILDPGFLSETQNLG